MRVAFLSDIHCNLQAWRAVRDDMATRRVDQIVCLGDVVGNGPSPAVVLKEVHETVDHFVLGNHDAVVAGSVDPNHFHAMARQLILYSCNRLSDRARRFFRNLPLVYESTEFSCSHASPAHPEHFAYVDSEQEARRAWERAPHAVHFTGHTHDPILYELTPDGRVTSTRPEREAIPLDPGCRYLINSGSVSMARDEDYRASYVVFDSAERSVQWHRVAYDLEGYAEEVRRTFRDPKVIEYLLREADPEGTIVGEAAGGPSAQWPHRPVSATEPPDRPGYDPEGAENLHLSGYLEVLLEHRRLILLAGILALVLGGVKLGLEDSPSHAAMRLAVRQELSPGQISGGGSRVNTRLHTYCGIIEGRGFAREVVQMLDIRSREDLGLSAPRNRISGRMIRWLRTHVPFFGPGDEQGPSSERTPRPEELAELLHRGLRARIVRGTNAIRITYRAPDRARAADICRAVTGYFLDIEKDHRRRLIRDDLRRLEQMERDFVHRVATSEQDLLEHYQKIDSYGLDLPTKLEGGAFVVHRKLQDLSEELAQMRIRRIAVEARLQALNSGRTRSTGSGGAESAFPGTHFQQMSERRRRLSDELATLRLRYGEQHPRIIQIKRTLALLDQQRRREKDKLLRVQKARVRILTRQEKSINRELELARENVGALNRQFLRNHVLKRAAQLRWQVLDTVIARRTQATLTAEQPTMHLALVDSTPRVYGPPPARVPTLLTFLVMGLGAGIMLAYFVHAIDPTLHSPDDMDQFGVEYLGTFAHSSPAGGEAGPLLKALQRPDSTLVENLRSLRSRILYHPRFRDERFLLMTSSEPLEGTSTLVCNLALLLVQMGKRVLLVDGNMRRPALHETFDLSEAPGLSEFLRNRQPITDVVRQSGIDNLSLIPCGSPVREPTDLIGRASDRWQDMIELSAEFDYVLMDSAPVRFTDPALMAGALDAPVLLVVRAGRPRAETVTRSVRSLREANARVAGALLNDFELPEVAASAFYRRYADYNDLFYRYGPHTGVGTDDQDNQEG